MNEGEVESMMVEVTDVPEQNRYVAQVDGRSAGLLQYRRDGERITLVHTEVDPSFEGRGVGSALARAALDDAREHGRRVRSTCPFVSQYIERHPQYQDLLSEP